MNENENERREYGTDEGFPLVCVCWVAKLDEESAFGVRFGAHCDDCPQYRQSGDPVDRRNDLLEHAQRCKGSSDRYHTIRKRTV